jgi:hypothetical protein
VGCQGYASAVGYPDPLYRFVLFWPWCLSSHPPETLPSTTASTAGHAHAICTIGMMLVAQPFAWMGFC